MLKVCPLLENWTTIGRPSGTLKGCQFPDTTPPLQVTSSPPAKDYFGFRRTKSSYFRFLSLFSFSLKYFSLLFFYFLFTVGISLFDVAQVMRIVWDEKTAVYNSRILISPDEYFNDPRPIIVAFSPIEGEDPCVRSAFDISLTRDEDHLRPMW